MGGVPALKSSGIQVPLRPVVYGVVGVAAVWQG